MSKIKLSLLFLLFLFACSKNETPSINYTIPEDKNDKIEVIAAAEVGMDEALLADLKTSNEDGTYTNIHSILVAKDNQLVFETYFTGKPIYGVTKEWAANDVHNLHSVTKSFNSALIGIAIYQSGLSLDDPIKDYFPEIDAANWTRGKENITIEDLLIMSSGLKWDEWSFSYDDERNDHVAMNNSANWVHFVLNQPMVSEPGSTFIYNSGLSITLGEIIKRKTGLSVGTFAQSNLFLPMRINQVEWSRSANQIYQTGGGLSLRPRDMLKFGLLFLNNGKWKNQQLISEEWVNQSTKQQGPNQSYGYQWWLRDYRIKGRTHKTFLAAGRGGQFIFVIRDLNLVVVFTAGNDNGLASSQTHEIMANFIIPSVTNL